MTSLTVREPAVRAIQSTDGAALQALMETDPPASGMAITTCFQVDPYRAWTTLKPGMFGAVAVEVNGAALVGCITAYAEEVQYQGRVRPAVFLENLKVHHAYRGQGLATRLGQWVIDEAQARFGADVLLISGTSQDNTASQATMRKWGMRIIPHQIIAPRPARRCPPQPLPGMRVRAATPDDLPHVAESANRFYAQHDFYPPMTAAQLAELLRGEHGVYGVYHYRVAENGAGTVIGGALLSLRAVLMVDEFRNVPLPLRVLSRLTSLLPADRVLRLMEVGFLWCATPNIGRYLWEHIRFEFRDRANSFAGSFDPRGPLAEVYRLKPWHVPRVPLVVSVRSPEPHDDRRLVCGVLRG